MAYKTLFNTMPDDSVAWGPIIQQRNCPRPLAQRIATKNPKIRSFFICRSDLKCRNGTFLAGTTVFLPTSPGLAKSNACDTYTKDFFNVGYLGGGNMPLRYAAQVRLKEDLRPFFDIVCLFTAGMQGARDDARLEIGGSVAHTLDHTDDVAVMQSMGIAVLLTVCGDWGAAGWSNFPCDKSAFAFADKLAAVVAKYGLDGIDIDDEFSREGLVNPDSIIMVTSRLREQAKDIIISKALWSDADRFDRKWNGKTLAQQLSHGWEMTYGSRSGIARLAPYMNPNLAPEMRMQKQQLALGVRNCPEDPANSTPPEAVTTQTEQIRDNAYGGMMVFGAEDYVRAPAFEALISKVFYNQDASNSPAGCWYLPTGALALAHSADEGNLNPLYISLAAGGQAFGPPIAVKASGGNTQETTNVGTAMAAFNGLLWFAWIGPTAGGVYNYPNVCSAKVDLATGTLAFNRKVEFSTLAKSVLAPAMVAFKDRLYLAWTDGAGNLQLMSRAWQPDAWGVPKVIATKVRSAPALGVVGDRLCVVALTVGSDSCCCWRSSDGSTFESNSVSTGKDPVDVGVATHGGWLHLAHISTHVFTGKQQIQVMRSQDGVQFEDYGSALAEESDNYTGVRLADFGPYMYIAAKDGKTALATWPCFFEGSNPYGKRQMLPTIQSVAKPSIVRLDV